MDFQSPSYGYNGFTNGDRNSHLSSLVSSHGSNGPSYSHHDKLESFRKADAERDAFVQQMIQSFEELQVKYQRKCDDYENEIESRRMWQGKADAAQRAVQNVQHNSNLSPFVCVLIDGDGGVFQDGLYQAGSDGGADAAQQLYQEIKRHVANTYPHENTSAWAIVVNIFCNVEGLVAKLRAVGILKHVHEFNQFVRAFGLNQPLFNVIDVGSGKERADYKLRETFRLFLPNTHCKHVVFGGISHDFGYLPMLDPLKRDPALSSRISLLETYPAQESFKQLGFPIFQVPNVFRSQNLPNRLESYTVSQQVAPMPPPQSTNPLPPQPIAQSQSQPQLQANMLTPPSTKSMPIRSEPSPAPGDSSWATVSKKSGNAANINVSSKKQPAPKFMLFNIHEERVDADLPRADRAAFERLLDRTNANKVCNTYHLLGKCDKEGYCDYDHGTRLTPGEQLSLKHHARKRCCPQRSNCYNFDCYFGHVCPHMPGCWYDNCFFNDVHHVNKTPAYKLYDNGKQEAVPS